MINDDIGWTTTTNRIGADGSSVTGIAALLMYEEGAATLNAGYNGGQGGY